MIVICDPAKLKMPVWGRWFGVLAVADNDADANAYMEQNPGAACLAVEPWGGAEMVVIAHKADEGVKIQRKAQPMPEPPPAAPAAVNAYEDKIEARRQRLENRAARLRAAANASAARGFDMLRAIPLGQPLLVDHYSYKRDRNYRDRAMRAIERAAALDKMAQAADLRAMGVGRAGISSDDPEAVKKLREKIEGLEAEQAQMKAMNAAWRKHGSPRHNEAPEVWEKIREAAGVSPELLAAVQRRIAIAPYQPQPFPGYALSNLSANIRAAKQRLEVLAQRPVESKESVVKGVRVVEDADENRVCLFFPGKPDEATRAHLKRRGFKWSPTRGAWVRMLNNAARYAAAQVLAGLVPA